jgi:hypothetical protein
MSEFKKYRKKGIVELRPYIIGEDLSMISISQEDNPKEGDMIARNLENYDDMWLVDKEYYEKHFEEISSIDKCSLLDDVVTISKRLLEKLNHNDLFLSALEQAGVDNWDGYDYAQDIMESFETIVEN